MHATTSNRARITFIGLIALLLAASGALALSANDAGAVSATVLGKTNKTPKSPCKEKAPGGCRIVVRTTMFQTVADGRGSIMKVPSNGHLVAWATSLGTLPSGSAPGSIDDLNKRFGDSVARLAVLKPKGKGKYKLTKQTPKIDLQSPFRHRPDHHPRQTAEGQEGPAASGSRFPAGRRTSEMGFPTRTISSSRAAKRASAAKRTPRRPSRNRRSARPAAMAAGSTVRGSSTGPTSSRTRRSRSSPQVRGTRPASRSSRSGRDSLSEAALPPELSRRLPGAGRSAGSR